MDTNYKYVVELTDSQRNELMFLLGEAKVSKAVSWSSTTDEVLAAVVNASYVNVHETTPGHADDQPDDTLVSPTLPPPADSVRVNRPPWGRVRESAKTAGILLAAMIAVVITMSMERCFIGP